MELIGDPRSGPYRKSRLIPAWLRPALRRVRAAFHRGPRLRSYEPLSLLVGTGHLVPAAQYPVIDVHSHLGRWLTPGGSWMAPDVAELLEVMDTCNLEMLVNLDGRWGEELEANLDRYDRAHPDRFLTFCHLDWSALGSPRGQAELSSLPRRIRSLHGARGIKVWKDLGLHVKVGGRRLLPNDQILGPIWESAGALGLPVLIHVADPLAFFQPVDNQNERLEQLLANPSSSLANLGQVVFDELIATLERCCRWSSGYDLHRRSRRLLPGEPRLGIGHARSLSQLLDRHLCPFRARSSAEGGCSPHRASFRPSPVRGGYLSDPGRRATAITSECSRLKTTTFVMRQIALLQRADGASRDWDWTRSFSSSSTTRTPGGFSATVPAAHDARIHP